MYFDTCTKNKESINETICPAYHIEPLKIELASPRFRLDSKLDLIGFIPSLCENVPCHKLSTRPYLSTYLPVTS